MGRHRTITTAALAALALSVPVSAAHASSTLLSGYGGPGQGNQALIGSSLIGGGGKTGGGGAGSSEAPSSSSSSSASPTGTSLALSQPRKASKHTPARHASKHAVSGTSTRTAPTSRVVSLAAQRSAGSGTLGLSGADAAYIAIAFAVLALTAVLTSRFARRAGRAGRAQ